MKRRGRSALLKGLFLACLIATTVSFVSLTTTLPVDSGGQSTSFLTGLLAPTHPGYPGDAAVMAMGKALVPKIESSQQFKSLANDESYHVEPASSFGYTWGASIGSSFTRLNGVHT
jgi:hypothetical protein